MLDIEQIVSYYPPHLRTFRKNLLREYLQYRILQIIYDSPSGIHLCFMGGTAAHIVYGVDRFSEDLDFDNLGLGQEDWEKLADTLMRELQRHGYSPECKTVFRHAYHTHIKFPDVLFDAGIAGHRHARLTIRVNAEPQEFQYRPDTFLLNKFDVFSLIRTTPAPLLLAEKICAILTRKRTLGRDFYDTSFLLGKTEPDYEYLASRGGIPDKTRHSFSRPGPGHSRPRPH